MKRKIYFVLMLMFILISCQKIQQQPLSKEMMHQIALLPQEAEMFGYMNFGQIRNSDIYQLIEDSTGEKVTLNKEYQEFVKLTGLDLKEDIDELYIAVKSCGDKKSTGALLVALGDYDPPRIMEYISSKDEQKEMVPFKYLDFDLYRIDEEDQDMCFGFVGNRLLVGGAEDQVRAWLDRYQLPAADIRMDVSLKQRIESLKYHQSAWFVMDAGTLMDKIEMGDAVRKMDGFRSMKTLQMSFRLSDDVDFDGELLCTDAEKAGLFKDAIKGAIAAAKLSASGDRRAVDVLNKIDIDQHQERIGIQFRMTKADVGKIIRKKPHIKLPHA